MEKVVKELCSFMEKFMVEMEDWNDENAKEQLRAIFTTICLVGKIDADTGKCDKLLSSIYWLSALEEAVEYDDFVNFMLSHIV